MDQAASVCRRPESPQRAIHTLPSPRDALHLVELGQARFLEDEVFPLLENRKKKLASRPLIREQAFGEAFDPDKLEMLGRYEVHLYRKLERSLAILLRLKEMRRTASSA